jgi:hypothetical protein
VCHHTNFFEKIDRFPIVWTRKKIDINAPAIFCKFLNPFARKFGTPVNIDNRLLPLGLKG